jgi:hypothetical protein
MGKCRGLGLLAWLLSKSSMSYALALVGWPCRLAVRPSGRLRPSAPMPFAAVWLPRHATIVGPVIPD